MSDIAFYNWGRAKIVPSTAAARPVNLIGSIAVHFKEGGTIEDKPSFAFECEDATGANVYVHEISLATLADVLDRAGYRLVSKKPDLLILPRDNTPN